MIRWALVVLLLAGCTAGGEDPVEDPGALQDLPTLTETTAQYRALRDRVRDAVTGALPAPGEWTEPDPAVGGAACEEGGSTAYLPQLVLRGGVPDDAWPAALAAVEEVAAAEGFGPAELLADAPGNHQAVLLGPGGARLDVGTSRNATIALETGCRREN